MNFSLLSQVACFSCNVRVSFCEMLVYEDVCSFQFPSFLPVHFHVFCVILRLQLMVYCCHFSVTGRSVPSTSIHHEGCRLLLYRLFFLLQSVVTARVYDQGLVRCPVTITLLILEYCSSSATRQSPFSVFWFRRTFTSSTSASLSAAASKQKYPPPKT